MAELINNTNYLHIAQFCMFIAAIHLGCRSVSILNVILISRHRSLKKKQIHMFNYSIKFIYIFPLYFVHACVL